MLHNIDLDLRITKNLLILVIVLILLSFIYLIYLYDLICGENKEKLKCKK